MNAIAMTGLMQIDLPAHTLRYCDGGFFSYDGATFRGADPVFGTVGGVDKLSEGVGNSVPALSVTLLPPDASAVATLVAPGHQTARVRFLLAEYDVATGTITSADVMFDGQIDQSLFTVGRGKRELAISVVSLAERLFEGNIGNSLNATWHKSVWPGETGHDQANGLAVKIAWGTEAPASGGGGFGGGGGGGGGGRVGPSVGRLN